MPAHKTNWFDFAPNVGVAWRPDVQTGFLRALLGDPEQATRACRLRAELQPGAHRPVHRERGLQPRRHGERAAQSDYRIPARLAGRVVSGAVQPAVAPRAAGLPGGAAVSDRGDDGQQREHLPAGSALETPRVHSYSAGVQRVDRQRHGLEVRYVGNQNNNTWAEEDWNERSIFDERLLRRVPQRLSATSRPTSPRGLADRRLRLHRRAPEPRRCRFTSPI